MIKFFTDLEDLHQFTLSLDFHQNEIQCDKCMKHDQFVSHGFVYKKQCRDDKTIVAKRIFCSNRYGRNGCGRTRQLYLAKHIPTLQYNTDHLFRFVLELIAYVSIQKAYQMATGTTNPRHAYRWLDKLNYKLVDFRTFILERWKNPLKTFNSRTHRFQLLLPTLEHLFAKLGNQPCTAYQTHMQVCFI